VKGREEGDDALESLVHLFESLDVRAARGHLGVEVGEPLAEFDRLRAFERHDDPVGIAVPEQAGKLHRGHQDRH
jgi:hypothetical protein